MVINNKGGNKMLNIFLMIFMLCLTTVLSAQEISIISKENVPTEKEIVDLLMEKNERFLLTEDGNIITINYGQIIISPKNQFMEFYKRKINSDLPQNFDLDHYRYFTKGNSLYFVCIFDWSYSSRIVKINPITNIEEFFCYLKGIPSGMCFADGKLWYLSNRNKTMSKSILRSYDERDSSIILEMDIPILDAKGLTIDEKGNFITYENQSKSIIIFRIDGGK